MYADFKNKNLNLYLCLPKGHKRYKLRLVNINYVSKVLKFIITNTLSTAKSVSNSSKSPSEMEHPEKH